MIAHIHPSDPKLEQTVLEHLEGTAQFAKEMGETIYMENLSYLAGLYHDIGKWRKEFEQYLRDSVAGKAGKARGSVNHSSAGAIYIYRKYYSGNPLQKLTAQLICYAILSHHGLNDCMSVEGEDCFRKRVENLESLDYEEVISNLESSSISADKTNECFKKAMEEVNALQNAIAEHALSTLFTNGLIARMLLSVLIDADRLDTAIFCGDRVSEEGKVESLLPWDIMGENIEKKLNCFPKKAGVFAIRRKIADECLEFANHAPGIYRLAVPTGGAKTLSSMRYAIAHAKHFHKKHIFYIGPYLSILEQNSQVFREALGMEELILEHHSNVVMEESEDGEVQNQYRYLAENWNVPIVITTFVQFLNTLFAGKTSSIRRFHNLADSVIIIDEIQSLPITMLYIFNMTMNYLSQICNTTIVLCSATQPVLEKVDIPIHMATPTDMILDVDGLYKKLKRVRIEAEKKTFTTDGISGFLKELIKNHKDILVILNTKTAAKKLYLALADSYEESGEAISLIHLSTNMCAEHRLSCINRIREREKGERLICISTSLIEAGVDLSFSCVVRSFAGLDSIAQAAGRGNRNGEEKEGMVYLIHYEEERLGELEQIRKGAACSEVVVEQFERCRADFYEDLLSRPALQSFYERYYYDSEQKRLMNYINKKQNTNLVDLLSGNRTGKVAYAGKFGTCKNPDLLLYQAFKTAGECFTVIDQDTMGVLVPFGEGKDIINKLNGEMNGREIVKWIRKGQRFTVNLYREQLKELMKKGGVTSLNNGQLLALKEGFYSDHLGVFSEEKQEIYII